MEERIKQEQWFGSYINKKCTAGCVKNPVGKATSRPRDENEKLLRNCRIQHLSSQPDIECFGVLEFPASEPSILFFAITDPPYEVFESTPGSSFVNYVPNKVLGIAIFIDNNRMWFAEFT